jgi:hypothetical protein
VGVQVQIDRWVLVVGGRGAGDAMGLQVDQVVADPDTRDVVADRHAAGDRPQAGQQLVDVEGLGDVVVGAGVEGFDLGGGLTRTFISTPGRAVGKLGGWRPLDGG